MTRPILYSFRRCPYAMRARLALAVSGIDCELREVRLSDKPLAMLAASPKGTVPVLHLPDGTVIDESLEIMHWALQVQDPEQWLTRDDPTLIALCDGPFKHALNRYKYPQLHGSDPIAHRDDGLAFLRKIDERLAATSHLCGSTRGLADAAIMPFIRQFAAVDKDWFDAQPLRNLKAWLAEYLQSTLFDTIMARAKPSSPGDQPVAFAQSQSA